jgi:hypothetical protein
MARRENKPILVVAYQGSASSVEQVVLSAPPVTQRSPRFVTAMLDAATQASALGSLRITEYPTLAILDSQGRELWRKKSANVGELTQAMDGVSGGAPPP